MCVEIPLNLAPIYQVAGIVDALHEAINAGYPDDPNMHGLIAGLWSSLSGAGRLDT